MAQNTTRGANTPRKGRSSFNLVSLERRVDFEVVSSVAVDEGVGWLFSLECCVEICPSSNGLRSWLSSNAFTEGCSKKNDYVYYKQDLKSVHRWNHVSVVISHLSVNMISWISTTSTRWTLRLLFDIETTTSKEQHQRDHRRTWSNLKQQMQHTLILHTSSCSYRRLSSMPLQSQQSAWWWAYQTLPPDCQRYSRGRTTRRTSPLTWTRDTQEDILWCRSVWSDYGIAG